MRFSSIEGIDAGALAEAVERDGFAIVERVLSDDDVYRLVLAIELGLGIEGLGDEAGEGRSGALTRRGQAYAGRRVLERVPEARAWAWAPRTLGLVRAGMGPAGEGADALPFPVRGLWFDKVPGANWAVPWHQDRTIAVERRVEAPGFGPWSVKDGAPHVEPPVAVLQGMLTLRLHLDPCDADNGPLRVLPGSHSRGRLDDEALRAASLGEAVACLAPMGGAVLMRPLLAHASSPAVEPRHRRVLHVEYADRPLGRGLDWRRA